MRWWPRAPRQVVRRGWWIAWSPFVGMFIAKISRGRTVRQIILGALSGPVLYSCYWFAMFGGVGLRIERQAANLGVTCADDPPMMEVGGSEYWRLSCRGTDDMWFDMLTNFPMHRCVSVLTRATCQCVTHAAASSLRVQRTLAVPRALRSADC